MKNQKLMALGLAAALCFGVLNGCVKTEVTVTPTPTAAPVVTPSATPSGERTAVNFAVLKGPSGIGAAELLSQNEQGKTENDYKVTIAAENSEVGAGLIKGSFDIAAVASNVAANLYHQTDGGVQVAAVSGLGVLYLLENGDSVQSFADLKGRTVYAMGQGANPEYVLDYLLTENGVDPADVDVQWATADEVSARMSSGEAELCMLPVPAATAVLKKNAGVRQALDFSAQWDALQNGSQLTMTTIVVRTAFAQEQPQAVEAFLKEYRESVLFMTAKSSAAIQSMATPQALAVKYGFAPSEEIAQAAIPQCNLVCITGVDDVRNAVQGYYEVLYQADPASIGGAIPDDGFYYSGQ